MLNELLIFTAIILLPINAILRDHVDFRRSERKRLKKKKGFSLKIDVERINKAFSRLGSAAQKAGLAFQQLGISIRNQPYFEVQPGTVLEKNGKPFGVTLSTPTGASRKLEEAFLREENRIFGITEEPVSWSQQRATALEDIREFYRQRITKPLFDQWMECNFPDEYHRIKTDEARKELEEFRCSLIKGVDDKSIALGIFNFARQNRIDTRNLDIQKDGNSYVVNVLPTVSCAQITFSIER